jgi:hypothetical protein
LRTRLSSRSRTRAGALGTLAIDRASGYDLISSRVTGSPVAVQTLLSTMLGGLLQPFAVTLATLLTLAF